MDNNKNGKIKFTGTFHVVHRDKDGNVLSEETSTNVVTNEGLDYLLDAACNGGTAISGWYFAPWSATHTPAAGNTYAVPGYTEATTQITEATRQEWAEGAASSQSITNAVAATITANGAVTIHGVGVVGGGASATTKGDTAGGGTLLASKAFAASKTLADTETLDITYTLSASSS